MSVSIENFIKTVYLQSHLANANTKIGTLANIIGVSSAAATDMAQKLARRKLINYQKYKPLQLTFKGEQMAISVIRKHRLWETFLHQTLGLSLHEIHQEAELLEHQTSEFLANKIEAYLDFPQFDPHGDPIPNENGIEFIDFQSVIEFENGTFEIARLHSRSKEFFQFCESYQLIVGTELQLIKKYKESKVMEIQCETYHFLLPFSFAQNIYVKPISS